MHPTNTVLFENFSEYWRFCGSLNENHRKVIFSSLPEDQKKKIQKSYQQGGWKDLFRRNQIDTILDGLKEKYGMNLLSLKLKIMSGKSHYMKKVEWDFIVDSFKEFLTEPEHLNHIFGGLKVEEINKDTVLIIKI